MRPQNPAIEVVVPFNWAQKEGFSPVENDGEPIDKVRRVY
jgi:hypothetical protein